MDIIDSISLTQCLMGFVCNDNWERFAKHSWPSHYHWETSLLSLKPREDYFSTAHSSIWQNDSQWELWHETKIMVRKKFSEKFSLLNFIYRIMPEIKRYYSTEKEKSNGLLSQCSGFTQGIFWNKRRTNQTWGMCLQWYSIACLARNSIPNTTK